MSLMRLVRDIRLCQVCENDLKLGPRPILRVSKAARLLIISQAPGIKVHQTGIPWNDASGDRLRHWMQLDESDFYDKTKVAFVPIGFCYPGAAKNGGDLPPRPECAPLWHERVLAQLPNVRLTVLVGQHSQIHYLGSRRKKSMTETVRAFAEYCPNVFPLPHPSWRSTIWMRKHPWFESAVLPELQRAVQNAVGCVNIEMQSCGPIVESGKKCCVGG